MPSDTRPAESHVLFVGESAKVFCADFQDYAPVANGETLSSPSVSVTNWSTSSTGVTLAGETVLTADFVEYDRNDVAIATVPSGMGVKFTVTPVTRGQYTVTVLVVCSGGSTEGKQVKFVVN